MTEELKRKLISFVSHSKSYNIIDLQITQRDLLDMVMKEERNKGREYYLSDTLCTRKRCDTFNDSCTRCIKSYWLKENV